MSNIETSEPSRGNTATRTEGRAAARLALVGVTKRYPGVTANDRIDLEVAPGEIHAVLGENGAGKSTLMKIIYGAVRPDDGELWWDGARVRIDSPAAARQRGIAMVFQHFALFETLTVAENVWLGLDGKLSRGALEARLMTVARDYDLDLPSGAGGSLQRREKAPRGIDERSEESPVGVELDPAGSAGGSPQRGEKAPRGIDRRVLELSVGERQRVEIVRALMTAPRLLILDEPTSVLTPQAVERLFVTLRRIAGGGCSILYISHKLDEVRALCHRCTVLRAGRVTGVVDPRTESNARLASLMLGATPPPATGRTAHAGEVALEVRGLVLPAYAGTGDNPREAPAVSFALRAGEVLGIAGVSGNGQADLLAAVSGEARAPAGTIWLSGADVSRMSTRQRRALGLRYVPEERIGHGSVASLSLTENLLLTRDELVTRHGWLRRAAASALATRLLARFAVKAEGPDAAAGSLSGGNLQKLIVGREIDAAPRVLVVAQPTWGLDVGAAGRIRAELMALADAGCAVLVISEDLEELFAITSGLMVIAGGRLSPRVATAEAGTAQIGAWMGGVGL